MDSKLKLEQAVMRLRAAKSIDIAQIEIAAPVSEDELETLKILNASTLPDAIMEFYHTLNGVKLLWGGKINQKAVSGSLNILSCMVSALRASAQEGAEPLENVLWNEDYDSSVLQRLKRMAIFESVAGRSAFLTFCIDEGDARLFLVEDDSIKQVVPDFKTAVDTLFRFAGAGDIRRHLTKTNWKELIESDQSLQAFVSMPY